mgnify:CR=1 FL=1
MHEGALPSSTSTHVGDVCLFDVSQVCLFGAEELSLRDAMREPSTTDAELRLLIHTALSEKKAKLGGHGDMHGIAASAGNRPMTLIGG